MNTNDYNKVQINYNVRKDKDGNVLDKSVLINIRCDSADEAYLLYKNLKDRLNGELGGNAANTGEVYVDHIGDEKIACPKCGGDLVQRTVKNGTRAGSQFIGCTNYPECRYTA